MTTEQEYAKMWHDVENTALEKLIRLMGYGVTEAECVGILLQKIKDHPEIKEKYKAKTRFHINNVIKAEASVLDTVKYLFASKVTRSYVLSCFDNACENNFKAGYYMLNKDKQDEFYFLNNEAKKEILYAYKEMKGMTYNEIL